MILKLWCKGTNKRECYNGINAEPLTSGGTRAVQKGAKKALPLIITNSKAKKKGAHFEHLNYHFLSILIVVYHNLFPDAPYVTN